MADRDGPVLAAAGLVVCQLPTAEWLDSAELAIATTARQSRVVLVADQEVLSGPVADRGLRRRCALCA